MNTTSAQDLSEQIKRRAAEKQAKVQQEIEIELDKLINSIRKLCADAESTIVADINSLKYRTLRKLLWVMLHRFSAIFILLCALIVGLFWTGKFYGNKIIKLENTVRELKDEGGGIDLRYCGPEEQKRRCVQIDLKAGRYGEDGEYRIIKGY